MRPRVFPLAAAAAVFASALAAQPTPRVGYVFPAGGRQGTVIEVRVGGQFLNGASKAFVSGQGVEAKVIGVVKPPSGSEVQFMREEMQKLNQKRAESFKRPPAGSTGHGRGSFSPSASQVWRSTGFLCCA